MHSLHFQHSGPSTRRAHEVRTLLEDQLSIVIMQGERLDWRISSSVCEGHSWGTVYKFTFSI